MTVFERRKGARINLRQATPSQVSAMADYRRARQRLMVETYFAKQRELARKMAK